ncbi:hypothetical protein V6N13_067532 [Hibiscus sabdariffa]
MDFINPMRLAIGYWFCQRSWTVSKDDLSISLFYGSAHTKFSEIQTSGANGKEYDTRINYMLIGVFSQFGRFYNLKYCCCTLMMPIPSLPLAELFNS